MAAAPDVIRDLRRELKTLDKPENKIDVQRFYKEKVKHPSVLRTSLTRKISLKYYREIRHLSKNEIFELCEILLDSGIPEERVIGFDWAYRIRDKFAKSDFSRFKKWLDKYVGGWGSCDHYCSAVMGPYLLKFPEMTEKTVKWARSNKRWYKRAAAVSLIPSLQEKKKIEEAFEVADILLHDEDDLIQKAYGWMLKVASEKFRDRVFAYIIKNRGEMPRTALRYAIEKMPSHLRRKAMAK